MILQSPILQQIRLSWSSLILQKKKVICHFLENEPPFPSIIGCKHFQKHEKMYQEKLHRKSLSVNYDRIVKTRFALAKNQCSLD